MTLIRKIRFKVFSLILTFISETVTFCAEQFPTRPRLAKHQAYLRLLASRSGDYPWPHIDLLTLNYVVPY